MNHSTNKGFTIIELMLAMSFVAFLMLAIAMTTIQISNIYTRGITLREVNQVGRAVIDDLQRTVGASAPFDVATNYKTQTNGGRLCLGAYTYVWNTGAALEAGGAGIYKYNDAGNTPVHFARVADAGSNLCKTPTSVINKAQSTELLMSGERDLAIHSLSVNAGAKTAALGEGQGLYAITMVIGTNGGSELITSGNGSCKPPADAEGEQEYCSVNQFSVIVRAGNNAEKG